MDSQVIIKDAATLRHTLQIKKRLQLEFLASLSNLLREHNVAVDDTLLTKLVLATTSELMGGVEFKETTSLTSPEGDQPFPAGFAGSAEAELLTHMMGQNPSAPVYNVIMTRTSDPRVINLVLGLGPQPGGGSVQLGLGPQPGGGAGTGPQPGGAGTGLQPGGGAGTGPQPGGGGG